jgi:hypothetical protein
MAVNLPQTSTNAGYPLFTGQPFLVSGSGAYLVYDSVSTKWENAIPDQTTYKTYKARTGNRGPTTGEVIIDNYRISLTLTGNASLAIATVAGTRTINFSTQAITTLVYGYSEENRTVSTTFLYFVSGYNLTVAGNMQEVIWQDNLGASYRATLLIGPGYANNIITVEKLGSF